MGRDDGRSEDIAWFDVGSEPAEAAPPRLPWPRWFTLAVALAVVVAGVAALNHVRRSPAAARVTAAPTTSASASRSAPTTSAAARVPLLPVISVTRLGHPLLGAQAGWELFGRSEGVLVRIQPAAGRITRTTIPDLLTSGPVFMVAGSDQVVIRPLDAEPGYLVPDGKPARQLPAHIQGGVPIYPGPAPNQVWVSDDNDSGIALETLAGARLAGVLPVPRGSSAFAATPDGAGYLLLAGVGGVYDARPDGLRRVTTGTVLAVGPTGWLVVECDELDQCHTVLIDRVDGSRRVMSAAPVADLRGVISPDGSTAAIVTSGPDGTPGLCLLDLASGKRRVLDVSVSQEDFDGGIVFSPDSTWLFAVTPGGILAVINRRSGAVGSLGAALPALSQVVLRPAR